MTADRASWRWILGLNGLLALCVAAAPAAGVPGPVRMLAAGGIPNLKLYFMIGLPTETVDDVQAIVDLTGKIRQVWEAVGKKQGRLGRLQLSVNPFVPKPWTPLQWAAGLAGLLY